MARLTLLRARRVIATAAAPAIEDGAVLLEGTTIRSVGRAAEIQAPDGAAADTIDYGDATLLPGLIDVHTHPSFPPNGDGLTGEEHAREADTLLLLQAAQNARTMLESGVTTAREMGAKGSVGFDLKEGIRRGLITGPRMLVAGRPVTMTGGHMWFYGGEADGTDAVRRVVRQQFKEGADYIKVAATGGGTRISSRFRPSYSVEELAVVADEAHRIGKLVAAHASSSVGVANCLDAGIDLIAHGYFYEPDGSYQYRPELADRLAAAAFVNPTLYLRQAEIDAAETKRERDGRLSARDEARLGYSIRSLEQRLDGVARMATAGVRIVAGSDSPFGRYPAGQFVREITMLTRAGFTPAAAIRAATDVAADAIGLGDRVGALKEGMAADVLVVRGDPLTDVAALWDVEDVYADGRRVDRRSATAPQGGSPVPAV